MADNAALKEYKKQAIRAAKDLFYSDCVIHQLEQADSEAHIKCVMECARKDFWRNRI